MKIFSIQYGLSGLVQKLELELEIEIEIEIEIDVKHGGPIGWDDRKDERRRSPRPKRNETKRNSKLQSERTV